MLIADRIRWHVGHSVQRKLAHLDRLQQQAELQKRTQYGGLNPLTPSLFQLSDVNNSCRPAGSIEQSGFYKPQPSIEPHLDSRSLGVHTPVDLNMWMANQQTHLPSYPQSPNSDYDVFAQPNPLENANFTDCAPTMAPEPYHTSWFTPDDHSMAPVGISAPVLVCAFLAYS